MKIVKFHGGEVYVSNEIYNGYKSKRSFLKEWGAMQEEGINSLYQQYLSLYGKLKGLEKNAVLVAHGINLGRKLAYWDNNEKILVQDWINFMDGEYAGLFLCVCNVPSATPTSKKSAILVPDREITSLSNLCNNVCFDLILPGRKVITSYTIERDLEEIKERLEKKGKTPKKIFSLSEYFEQRKRKLGMPV